MPTAHPSLRLRTRFGVFVSVAIVVAGMAETDARAGFDVATLGPYEGFLVTEVTISGQDVTAEYVIRREIRIQPGDPFRVADAHADLVRLENLGIFSSQIITAAARDSSVALTYEVREMPWIVPYPMFEYTEVDGFSIGLGVASVNMLGRAIHLSGSGTAGGIDAFSIIFKHPWITGNHLSLDAAVSDNRRNDPLNDFREHSREVTPWVGGWIGDTGRLAATVSWFQMNADRDGVTLSPDRRDEFLRLGIRGGVDTRDSWRNPARGWNNEVLAMWYDGSVFDEPGDWPLVEVDLRRYESIGGRENTIVAGALFSWQDGQADAEIPRYLQYRMGGANSIRGYDIEELGEELFGKNQLLFTLEYQREIVPLREFRFWRWAISAGLDVAAFMDAGNAWNRPQEFNSENSRAGFGVGLRFLVPAVNELRTDIAIGEDGAVFFHFGVGDKLTAQRGRLR